MSNMPSSPTRYSSHQTLHFHITSFSIHVCIFHVSFWIYGNYNYLTSGLISPPVCQFQLTSSLWITFCCSFLCPITSVFDAKHHTVSLVQYLLSIQSCKNSGEAETVLTRRQYYTFFCNIIGYLVSTGTVPCFGCAQKCFLSSNPLSGPFCSLKQELPCRLCCSHSPPSFARTPVPGSPWMLSLPRIPSPLMSLKATSASSVRLCPISERSPPFGALLVPQLHIWRQ